MRVSELTRTALDWAVAKCEGGDCLWYDTIATHWMTLNGKDIALSKGWAQSFTPSTDWAQGGPIIEREKIEIFPHEGDGWGAMINNDFEFNCCETPLIAAMRCYVASKLGDEVEIPAELLTKEKSNA